MEERIKYLLLNLAEFKKLSLNVAAKADEAYLEAMTGYFRSLDTASKFNPGLMEDTAEFYHTTCDAYSNLRRVLFRLSIDMDTMEKRWKDEDGIEKATKQ